jgi:nucleotide-binding universal stress UspA family protein
MAEPEITTPRPPATDPKDAALKKGLVVTDFSPEASAAIDHAETLANLVRMQLVILHVVEVPKYLINPEAAATYKTVEATFEALRQRAGERLEAVCEQLRQKGIDCTESVRIGIPSHEILSEAETISPDILIMGKKGTSGVTGYLLGSTAERVVRHARCPVLVVPGAAP